MYLRTRPHMGLRTLLIALTGLATGLAAVSKVGPFAYLGPAASHTVAAQAVQPQLRAGSLYPVPTPPPTVKRIIEVPGPARVVMLPPAPQPEPFNAERQPQTTAEPDSAPTAQPTAQPTPAPCYDDCSGDGEGGHDDGGGGTGGGDH